MTLDPIEIWNHMSGLNKAIAVLLLAMGVATVGVVIERLLAFARANRESRQFIEEAAPLLDAWRMDELVALAERYPNSGLARLVGAMMRRYQRGLSRPEGGLSPIEMARSEVERTKEGLGAELRRGFTVLSSVASVAPFVGLLGTVVGIIMAFNAIGAGGDAGMSAVMTGIAEALFETALGLMIAIPAVLFFNYLTGRVNQIELTLARSSGELLDEMESRHETPIAEVPRARQAA
ncbi:MAG: MotA/TolQ/ExbB proton channel family protein [Polyangiaceae bacterium]|nr:MotA/TolQ/ExbB proton channel family protein [Polyangiaceae bacterium]MCW5789482.1 MotA/TolQ/ExbB proton channel family protein [Polyangiaceae bacterium]